MRRDLGLAEAAHLGPDRLERVVEPGITDRRGALAGADESDEAGAALGRVAGLDQRLDRLGAVAGEEPAREADRWRGHHLALAQRDAAEDLVEVFADADAPEEVLGLPEAALARGAAGRAPHLADRLGIGRKPGEPMRRVLLGLEPLGRDAALGDDLCPHP